MEPTSPASTTAAEPLSSPPRAAVSLPPVLVGLRAARANLAPGLFLQAVMLATVFAYYCWPVARPWFDRLGELKRSSGYLFTIVSAVLAGSVLPEVFKWCYLQRRLPVWNDGGEMLFAAGYYATSALTVDCMYRCQAIWFGVAVTPAVLLVKVFVDQFIYNPVFAAPFAVSCFGWKNRGYSFPPLKEILTADMYVRRVVPTLVAGWIIWIPVVVVLYSLPPPLQIPVYCLALCFWALMLTYIHTPPKPAGSGAAYSTKKKASASRT